MTRAMGQEPTREDLEHAIATARRGELVSDHGFLDSIDYCLTRVAQAAVDGHDFDATQWADQAREAFDGERVATPFDLSEFGISST